MRAMSRALLTAAGAGNRGRCCPAPLTNASLVDRRSPTLSEQLVLVIFMLFNGFYINVNNITDWCSWIRYLSFQNYGVKARAGQIISSSLQLLLLAVVVASARREASSASLALSEG